MNTSDVSNIIHFIENYWPDFVVTPQLLEHPTSEFVINFYQHFYRSKMELLENIVEHPESTSLNMPKPDIDSPIALVRFINQNIKNITDEPLDMMLCLTDIYTPTAARTKVMFKILCNVLLWFEDKAMKVKSTLDHYKKRATDFQQKLIEKEQNKTILASKAEQHAYIADKFEKLEKLKLEVKQNYNDMRTQKEERHKHFEKRKEDLKTTLGVFQNKVDLLTELKNDVQYLTTQIVDKTHYESLQDLQNNRNQKLAEINTEISDITVTLQNRKLNFESLSAVDKQLEKLILNTEELQQTKNVLMDNEIQLKNLETLDNTLINDLKNIKKNKLIRKENRKEIENSYQAELDKNKILIEQLEEEKIKINKELVEEENFQQVQMNKKLALEEEISLLTKKLKDNETNKKMFRNYCESMYASISNKENETTKNFEKVLKSVLNTSNEVFKK